MKIAMVGTRGVPAHYGGFETAVEEIGARLAAMGEEVVVFCRPVDGEPTPSTYRGMTLVWLPSVQQRALETLSHTALSVLRPELKGVDAAIVFNAANAPLIPVLRARGIPVATHVDGLEWRRSKWSGLGKRYYRWVEALAVRWSDQIIADAAGISDYYQTEFGADSRLIAYGAPDLAHVGHERLAQMGLEPDQYHLVVARFEPENHVLEIIKGYVASDARLPLVVVGSAPYAEEYSAAIRNAADERVRLLGGVWDQDLLDQLYANAATYLHGHSVGGTNPSLLRAVGAGRPTIAYDSVFNREVLGEAGRYFTSPQALARELGDLEAHPDHRRELGQAAGGRAAHYSWERVAEEYRRLCADLVAGRRAPRVSGRRLRPSWVDSSENAVGAALVAHPSPDLYGSDRVLLETLSALVATGRRTVLALPEPGPLTEAAERRGAEVRFCPTPILRKSALRPLGMLRLVRDTIRAIGPERDLIKELDPDLVVVNTLTIPLWLGMGRASRRRTICHVHEAEASQPALLRRLLYAPLLLADALVVNSRFSLDVLASSWPFLRRRAKVVYNGVPGPQKEPSPPRRELGSAPRLLFLGRLSPRKGPQVAVAAVAELRARGISAQLTLLGSVFAGYEWFEEDLRRRVADLGLAEQVEFVGFDPDIWAYLSRTDIVCVPSIVDEPFGNTAVEAMLAGRPLVVSDTSGLKEAADGFETVRFVTPDDPVAIADAVQSFMAAWPTVVDHVAGDREQAERRHAPSAYAEALIGALGANGHRSST